MNRRSWMSLEPGLYARLKRDCHGTQESEPTMERGVAHGWSVRVVVLLMKDGPAVRVGDSLAQGLV